MSQIKLKFLSGISFLILISCSNSQVQRNEVIQKINIVDIQTWINLMPGGPGSFHVTGEYEFDEAEKGNLSLLKIIVFFDDKTIYEINSDNFSNELQPGESYQITKFRFYTKSGLKLNEMIRTVEKINVKLIYDFDGELIEMIVNDIYVTRAY